MSTSVQIETVNTACAAKMKAQEASENLLGRKAPQAWAKVGFMMPASIKLDATGHCYYASCEMTSRMKEMLSTLIQKRRTGWATVFTTIEHKSKDRTIGLLDEAELKPFRDEMHKLLPQLGGMFQADATILQATLIRITPMGTIAEALASAQASHRDTNQTIYDESGEVHSVFCVEEARVIRVTELETGQDQLLVMEGGVAHAIHGRWRHSGWCLPKNSNKVEWKANVCLFMYVACSRKESMASQSIPPRVT